MESNNWEQRFDELTQTESFYAPLLEYSFLVPKLKSFISQEIEKAREEGRQEVYIKYMYAISEVLKEKQ